MNTLLAFVSETALQALGWTLVHFLWQGIVVFLLLGSAMQMMRLQSPHARYLTSCVALLLMLLLPLATFRTELGDARRRQRQQTRRRYLHSLAHNPVAQAGVFRVPRVSPVTVCRQMPPDSWSSSQRPSGKRASRSCPASSRYRPAISIGD